MIKLLYITNGINGSGGLERVLSVKASYLAESFGYEVTIITLNEKHPNSFYTFSPKVTLRSITVAGNSIAYMKNYVKSIKTVVNELCPDIISVCDDGLKGFFVPKILNANIPIIYERHVSKEIEINHNCSFWKKIIVKLKWKLMNHLGSSFSKFVVLTNGNLNEWESLKNVRVIPNPLSFYPETSSVLINKKVIAVGKQSYQKGYDLLLKSWALVSNEFSDWQLEIYGKKELDDKLEILAKSLDIQDNIAFYEPEKNIQEKYLESSIFVMSSRYEGFGMVLIEAMACGLPCVSFNCNYGPSDIIENEVDGIVVPKGNTQQLAEALSQLIKNIELRNQMGFNAKENVKRYLPENVLAKWDQLFKELTN